MHRHALGDCTDADTDIFGFFTRLLCVWKVIRLSPVRCSRVALPCTLGTAGRAWLERPHSSLRVCMFTAAESTFFADLNTGGTIRSRTVIVRLHKTIRSKRPTRDPQSKQKHGNYFRDGKHLAPTETRTTTWKISHCDPGSCRVSQSARA